MRTRHRRSDTPFAKRSLGQNFLVSQKHRSKIIDSLGEVGNDLVIEIGPGRGALTQDLAFDAKYFVAIELDRVFAASLEREYREYSNV